MEKLQKLHKEYIPEEIEDWRTTWCRTKTEKQRGMPEKYTYDDWNLGHYIKEKKNNGKELLL